jgi:lysophospholipase L1-like esterase
MKHLLFILLLLPVALKAQNKPNNQNLYDTIPTLPDHYKQRVEQFSHEPVTTGHIIFLGNSITEMGDWKKATNDTTVINRGIGGDVTYGILKRLDDITVRKPSKLFILIGINDISKDIPDAVIADNYLKIVNTIHAQSPDTKIYVQSILPLDPTHDRFPQHYDKQEHVISVNKMIKANAGAGHYTFINIYPLFLNKEGHLDNQYTIEGLHLKPESYLIWAKFLKDKGYL